MKAPTFGSWLADQIRTRNWTQKVFAERAGIPASGLSEIINDKPRTVTDWMAERIAAALGIDSYEVRERAGLPAQKPLHGVSLEGQEAARLIDSLPEMYRARAVRLLRGQVEEFWSVMNIEGHDPVLEMVREINPAMADEIERRARAGMRGES